MADWGKICVGTRLEKVVDAGFVTDWSKLIAGGLSSGDAWLIERGKVAHVAANHLVRDFLRSPCDSLLMLDSDAEFSPDLVQQFREYQPGFEYDLLQAFYPRRGWPPEAIWFQRNSLGDLATCIVLQDNAIQQVPAVGTHCVMIRRWVLEAMVGDNDRHAYDWFYYPRHVRMSEDIAFSLEVAQVGARMGATTAIKVGHVSRVVIGWETYQEYLGVNQKKILAEAGIEWREWEGSNV